MARLTKLDKIEAILAFDEESDAYYNLLGALIDLERMGADSVCIETMKRVNQQILSIHEVLKEKE